MLKRLQLGELARFRAFWAAGQSPQQPQPGTSLSAPTSAGSAERCVGSQDLTIVFSRFCPFLYPSFHFIPGMSVDTVTVSLFEDATYLSPTSSWVWATSGFTFISLAQFVQVKGSLALAHSQGKSRELDSSVLVSTSLGRGWEGLSAENLPGWTSLTPCFPFEETQ